MRSEGTRPLMPHLIVKHEKMIVKGQSSPAGHQILAEDLDTNAVYKITTEHTFPVTLITKETARTLNMSKQLKETNNTYSPRASCTNSSIEVMAQFCKPNPGPSTRYFGLWDERGERRNAGRSGRGGRNGDGDLSWGPCHYSEASHDWVGKDLSTRPNSQRTHRHAATSSKF